MFDRFTAEARQAVMRAQEESRLMHHGHVGTEHFLVALAQEPELARLGLDRERARAEVVKTVGLGDVDPALHGQIPFTAAAKEALNDALGEAMRLGQGQIRPGHLLLAVLKQRDGVARRIIVAAGATPSEFRNAVARRMAVPPRPSPPDTTHGIVARLNDVELGMVGDGRVDARLLLSILERGGPVADWLRNRGVDERAVRRLLE